MPIRKGGLRRIRQTVCNRKSFPRRKRNSPGGEKRHPGEGVWGKKKKGLRRRPIIQKKKKRAFKAERRLPLGGEKGGAIFL